jgi:glycosyltransferase involved in cell wall biosynthesis
VISNDDHRAAAAPGGPRRTVLVVAGEFPPVKTIGRLRTLKFVRHLEAYGWQAIVLTVAPNGTTVVADPALADEVPAGLDVRRVACPDLEGAAARAVKRLLGRGGGSSAAVAGGATPAPSAASSADRGPGLLDRLHRLLRRFLRHYVEVPDSYNLWAWRAARVAAELRAERRIDLVYTTLPPFSAAWVGYRLRRAGLPWVADYRDLWTGDVLREWLPAWRTGLERGIERRVIGKADAIITVSEQKTDYVRRLIGGPAMSRVRPRWATITNGYDVEEFAGLQRRREPDGTITFVFTGRLFKNRCGYAFCEALGELKRENPALASPVRVHFLGGVSPEIRARFDRIIGEHGLEGQFFFPGDIPYAEAKQAQIDADYLLLIVDTGATSDGVIPGKLFEYVAARRPIFALTDPGATASIIRDGRLGWVVDAEDTAGCKTLLAEVLAQKVPEVLAPDEAYLQQFDRRRLTARLAELFDAVVDDARGRR